MAKFGYRCRCGWSLNRGRSTRQQYAKKKRNHAMGIDPSADAIHQPVPCKYLLLELNETRKPGDKLTAREVSQ